MFFFCLRNENVISGEYINTKFILKNLRKDYFIKEIYKVKSKKKYISTEKFLKIFSFLRNNFKKKKIIIIKIPTSSQIPILEFIKKKNNNLRIIYLVDGYNFKIKNLSLLLKMVIEEPILLFQRFIINNNFWNLFLKYFKIQVVMASQTQKNEILQYMNRESKIEIIPNFNNLIQSKYVKKKFKLGFLGHNYPVKGLDHLIKASEILEMKKLQFKIYCKKPLRGKKLEVKSKKFEIVDLDLNIFLSKTDILIFPFRAEYGTNIYPSVLVESITMNKHLIIPDFSYLKELIKLCKYQKKTTFFKQNNFKDLAKKIEFCLKTKISNQSIKCQLFNHKEISLKWKKLINTN